MGLIVPSSNGSEIVCRLGSFYALNYKHRNGFDHGIYGLARGDLVRIAVDGTVWTGRVHYAGGHQRRNAPA